MPDTLHRIPHKVDFGSLYEEFPTLRNQPITRRILVENIVRHRGGDGFKRESIAALAAGETLEIDFRPGRVLMQDYAGMPALIDLAALRTAAKRRGLDPSLINPAVPVELVVDHSVMAGITGRADALARNLEDEYVQNAERYAFLKWAANAFDNLRIVPPGQGIVHQINIEVLASVVTEADIAGQPWHFPDTLIGTDSHTTMVNGIGVLGWGVGGVEAEAVMLGEAISILAPPVVSVELTGHLREGTLATDAVLSLTEFLRSEGVVGSIVEFCGAGVGRLGAADRLTIANMSPEFGSTAAYFPVDGNTLEYLAATGRSRNTIERVSDYMKEAALFHDPDFRPDASRHLGFDLSSVGTSVSGPRRPEERRNLGDLPSVIEEIGRRRGKTFATGDLVIASITSCTNTSNPEAMIAAGLLAKAARERGVTVSSRIKTSLAPGSRAVRSYLEKLGLLDDLAALGFDVVAYGCTTCVGNSGDLAPDVQQAIDQDDAIVAAVLSGNRNFEARVHPKVRANFLASPPLVVAYAIAGTMDTDLGTQPLCEDAAGHPVFLAELWPDAATVTEALRLSASPEDYATLAKTLYDGGAAWQSLEAPEGLTFPWAEESTYLCEPPFFAQTALTRQGSALIENARPLLVLGDKVTTDHISPVGRIAPDSPAAVYLTRRGVAEADFNAYGARRGDHDVMTRGTFANVRLENRLVARSGPWTRAFPSGEEVPVFEAARRYIEHGVASVVLAGAEYGAGSARDWAAKGTRLLGISAVIAESFERIHRSNLVRMGVLPVQMTPGLSANAFDLGSDPSVSVTLSGEELAPMAPLEVTVRHNAGTDTLTAVLLAETWEEVLYLNSGGILPFVAERTFAAMADAS